MAIGGASWETYLKVLEDGRRALVSFDVEAAQEAEHHGYAHGRGVVLFFDKRDVLSTGLPRPEASFRMKRIEQPLLEELRAAQVACRLVGRVLADGQREQLFQVEDLSEFEAALRRWHESVGWPQMRLVERPGWSFFDDQVKPLPEHWLQIQDQRLIDSLLQSGLDARSTHTIDFRLSGPAPRLQHVAEQLRRLGCEVRRVKQGLLVRDWVPLELLRIWGMSRALAETAAAFGLKYEGWELARPLEPDRQVRDDLFVIRGDGSPRVVLCPECLGQVDPVATTCAHCRASLTSVATVELLPSDYEELARVRCARCGRPRFARAPRCCSCGAAVRAERKTG